MIRTCDPRFTKPENRAQDGEPSGESGGAAPGPVDERLDALLTAWSSLNEGARDALVQTAKLLARA